MMSLFWTRWLQREENGTQNSETNYYFYRALKQVLKKKTSTQEMSKLLFREGNSSISLCYYNIIIISNWVNGGRSYILSNKGRLDN